MILNIYQTADRLGVSYHEAFILGGEGLFPEGIRLGNSCHRFYLASKVDSFAAEMEKREELFDNIVFTIGNDFLNRK